MEDVERQRFHEWYKLIGIAILSFVDELRTIDPGYRNCGIARYSVDRGVFTCCTKDPVESYLKKKSLPSLSTPPTDYQLSVVAGLFAKEYYEVTSQKLEFIIETQPPQYSHGRKTRAFTNGLVGALWSMNFATKQITVTESKKRRLGLPVYPDRLANKNVSVDVINHFQSIFPDLFEKNSLFLITHDSCDALLLLISEIYHRISKSYLKFETEWQYLQHFPAGDQLGKVTLKLRRKSVLISPLLLVGLALYSIQKTSVDFWNVAVAHNLQPF